jgi:hypothetical protein
MEITQPWVKVQAKGRGQYRMFKSFKRFAPFKPFMSPAVPFVQSVAFGRIKPHATSAASEYLLFPDTDAVFFFALRRAEHGHAVGEFVPTWVATWVSFSSSSMRRQTGGSNVYGSSFFRQCEDCSPYQRDALRVCELIGFCKNE